MSLRETVAARQQPLLKQTKHVGDAQAFKKYS
jgi:hypothetical protein